VIYTHIIIAVIAALATWFVQGNMHDAQLAKLKMDHGEKVSTMEIAAADERTAAAKEKTEAVQNARAEERAINKTYQEALNAARTREDAQRRDALAARAESDSLRSQLSEAARRIADAPPAALAEYAATTSELLAVCSRERTFFAEKADGHASDVRTLRDAWPVIPKVQPTSE